MPEDTQSHGRPERRREPRLPEELKAVMTDSAVAADLISGLPEDEQEDKARWVAEGEGRTDRARRAVDVVRDALSPAPRSHEDPSS